MCLPFKEIRFALSFSGTLLTCFWSTALLFLDWVFSNGIGQHWEANSLTLNAKKTTKISSLCFNIPFNINNYTLPHLNQPCFFSDYFVFHQSCFPPSSCKCFFESFFPSSPPTLMEDIWLWQCFTIPWSSP